MASWSFCYSAFSGDSVAAGRSRSKETRNNGGQRRDGCHGEREKSCRGSRFDTRGFFGGGEGSETKTVSLLK